MVSILKPEEFVFSFGGHAAIATFEPRAPFRLFTEDCFSGKLGTASGQPREVAPYPRVNPLTGPIAVEGLKVGAIAAIHIVALDPARDWGWRPSRPTSGCCPARARRRICRRRRPSDVWIWTVDSDGGSLVTEAAGGHRLRAPYRPFFGTIGVAPAHGEIPLSVAPGDFGGNLDIPDLTTGTTLYLRANVDGGHLYFGDGHFAQGDGEIAGTAIEGAFNATVVIGVLPAQDGFDWPRIETDNISASSAAPGRSRMRSGLPPPARSDGSPRQLDIMDAHQLVSQVCRLRIGNLVNPVYSALCMVPNRLGQGAPMMENIHQRLVASASMPPR